MLSPKLIAQAKSSPVNFGVVTSHGNYISAPHLELLDKYLLLCAKREIKRLMIFMPPQHGKSETVSHNLPVWWMGTFPEDEVVIASYGQEWAEHWGRECRNSMEEWGQQIFGIDVAHDSSAAGQWALEGHKGSFKATGIGGSLTGHPAKLLVIDDPLKNQQEAFSAVIHQRNIEWWGSVARTRLHEDSVVILMMTRWHPDDLAGWLLLHGQGWQVLSLPAIAEEDDMLGREVGEPLFPALHSLDWLLETKHEQQAVLEGYYWQAMYQQRPALPEGLLFFDKRSVDIGMRTLASEPRERFETRPLPNVAADGYILVWERPITGERYYIGADTADGKGEAVGTWGSTGGPDRNAAAIFRARDDVQVAEIYGRQEEHQYARVLNEWGRAYNNAVLAVERNRRSVLVSLRELNYPNLYYTDKPADMHVQINPDAVARRREWGWNTDVKSRPVLLGDLREAVSTGAIKIRSRAGYEEMGSFIMGDPPAAAPGQHDDRIFAYGVAWQARALAKRGMSQSNGGMRFMGGVGKL